MGKLKKVFRILDSLVEHMYPMAKQAKRAGVTIGEKNEFHSRFWEAAEPYLITIGDNCQITKGVKIFTHGGKVVRIYSPMFDVFGKVKIGNNVYIGNNSLIMPGVRIGNNVLVAAGSVITRSVPDNVVVGGNPAHIICSLGSFYERNLPYNLNTKGLSALEKKLVLLNTPDSKFILKRNIAEK